MRMFPIVALFLLTWSAPSSAATFRLELDYMVDNSLGNPHSHEPLAAELQAVVQMFACQGHTLIIEVSDALPHYNVLQLDPNDPNNFFDYDNGSNSFKAIRDAYFDRADDGGWHYGVFGHQYEWRTIDANGVATYFDSGSSGLGQTPGENFVVTLGTFGPGQIGTPFDRASTLAHEFGHTLGLTHCGDGDCKVVGANMPNLVSIMSYNYQLEGVRSGLLCNALIPQSAAYLFKELDFSGGRMCPLDENALDETVGTTIKAVDWNCDAALQTSVSIDLSSGGPTWCANSGSLEVIADYNEWGNLVDVTKLNAESRKAIRSTLSACIGSEEVEALRREKKANCAQPSLTTESCISPRTYWVKQDGVSTGTGSCNRAVDTVALGVSLASQNSAVVLDPGTYTESGTGSLVLDRDVVIYAAKSAIIR